MCESWVSCRGSTVNHFYSFSPWHIIPHYHPCLLCLTPSPHSSITRIYPSPCFCLFPGLLFCTSCHFFPPRWQWSRVFPLWFCIVSLSLVSRQWFYPMVGDIMLFYHRVEPRTGCWRVSASIRQSIPTSFHKPQNRGVWLWWWSSWCCCWWALNHSNMHLFVCFVGFIPSCVQILHFICVVTSFIPQNLVKGWSCNAHHLPPILFEPNCHICGYEASQCMMSSI